MTPPASPPRSLLSRLFLSAQERRLRAGWRLAIQFIWMVALLGLLGLPLQPLSRFLPGLSPQALLLGSSVIAFLAVTISVYLARRTLDRRSIASLGLRWDAPGWRDLLVGRGLSGLLMGFVYLVEWAVRISPAWRASVMR